MKQEDRQQIRCETAETGPHAWGDNVIDERLDERFEESDESARCRRVGLAAAVAAGHAEDDEHDDQAVDEQPGDDLRDRKVQRPEIAAVGLAFDDLAGMFALRGDAQPLVFGAAVQVLRREAVPSARRTADDHRQGEGELVAADRPHVPFVGIADVAQHDLLDVQPGLFIRLPGIRGRIARSTGHGDGVGDGLHRRLCSRGSPPCGKGRRHAGSSSAANGRKNARKQYLTILTLLCKSILCGVYFNARFNFVAADLDESADDSDPLFAAIGRIDDLAADKSRNERGMALQYGEGPHFSRKRNLLDRRAAHHSRRGYDHQLQHGLLLPVRIVPGEASPRPCGWHRRSYRH